MGLETAIGESSHLQGSAADVFKEASCDFRNHSRLSHSQLVAPKMTESAVLKIDIARMSHSYCRPQGVLSSLIFQAGLFGKTGNMGLYRRQAAGNLLQSHMACDRRAQPCSMLRNRHSSKRILPTLRSRLPSTATIVSSGGLQPPLCSYPRQIPQG